MIKRGILLILVNLFLATAFAQTKVILIPTIHSLHKSNAQYNYDSLKRFVERLNPDVIAVEIRDIDLNADTNYLKRNYPYEMWMMRYWFTGKIIEGFDWLGEELEGKPVPERYWQEQSQIKRLEKELDEDSNYGKKLQNCIGYTKERLKILSKYTLTGILASKDDSLIRSYYDCMEQQLSGSRYQQLPRFYDKRNKKMETRLHSIIQKHQNKVIVILTGDDHYPYLLDYLKTTEVQLSKP